MALETSEDLAVIPPKSADYQRVLIKISGEALMGDRTFGHDPDVLQRVAIDLRDVHAQGVEVCAVIGGGNIFRGVAGPAAGLERATADSMGMLATVINALALQGVLESLGVQTRVQSALRMPAVCEPFLRRRAVRHMEKGRIVIFAAGTGNPYFTTDTAAALRAAEMDCDAMLKGTQVDGVYSADPHLTKGAKRFDRLTFHDVLVKDLKVMDASAISLARDNNIPIIVFNIGKPGAFAAVIAGKGPFTLISGESEAP